jgi:hypothetical protein
MGTPLFTDTDADRVRAAVPAIMRDAEVARVRSVRPTLEDRVDITDTIMSFARERRRKVYGGRALNDAIAEVSPTHAFYADPPSAEDPPPDIEFYSPDPIKDVQELCDELGKRYEYVQAREAMHHDTFTVSVEFVRFCDVTYMPRVVYNKIPTRTSSGSATSRGRGGISYVHPSFAALDYLRVFCDPATSYWRLDRSFARFCLLQRFFPIVDCDPATSSSYLSSGGGPEEPDGVSLAMEFLRGSVDTCAAVGGMALACYREVRHPSMQHRDRLGHVSCVSVDFASDVGRAEALLVGAFGESRVLRVDHHPFIDLLGARSVFVVGGAPIMTIFDSGHRAVPTCGVLTSPAHGGMRVCSSLYCILTALSCSFLAAVDGAKEREALFAALARDFMALRSGEDPLGTDGSAFRDFGLDYIGETLSTMRVHMLMTDARRQRFGKGTPAWFTYDPRRSDPAAFEHHRFLNRTGNVVMDAKHQQSTRRSEKKTRFPCRSCVSSCEGESYS